MTWAQCVFDCVVTLSITFIIMIIIACMVKLVLEEKL